MQLLGRYYRQLLRSIATIYDNANIALLSPKEAKVIQILLKAKLIEITQEGNIKVKQRKGE